MSLHHCSTRFLPSIFFSLLILTATPTVTAESNEKTKTQDSPWLTIPLVSVSPKLGSAIGAMLGYSLKLDDTSSPSMIGVSGKYSSSESIMGAGFSDLYWNHDRQRVTAAIAHGEINNEYEDYLGSGYPFATTDRFDAIYGRYLHTLGGKWLAGLQGVKSDYTISAEQGQEILDAIGLTGIESRGWGGVIMLDTRDVKISPRDGWYAQASNIWFQSSGANDYEKYRLDIRNYTTVRSNWVLATQLDGAWSSNAPKSAWESVTLRSYTRGQYLSPSVTQLQSELRIPLAERWRATVFAGIACLYGDGKDCQDELYPMAGIGGQYVVQPSTGRVANLDIAVGKDSNLGIVLQMGAAF